MKTMKLQVQQRQLVYEGKQLQSPNPDTSTFPSSNLSQETMKDHTVEAK